MIDNIQKQMLFHVEEAIDSLEDAMNLVESDADYNDGQSEVLNALYDGISEVRVLLENVKSSKEGPKLVD